MKKIVLVLLVSVLGLSTVFASEDKNNNETRKAKTMQVDGTVIDATTGEALVGVAVSLEGSDEVVYTDFDGNFSALVAGDKNAAVITFVSYKEKKATLVANEENKISIEQL